MARLRAYFFRRCLTLLARLPGKGRRRVLVRIDDTIVEKPKESRHFEGADWHFDHTKGRNVFGCVFVTMLVSVGCFSCPLGFRLYLRAQTVRRLRRKAIRPQGLYGLSGSTLRLRSKFHLAAELLDEIASCLEEVKLPVTVLFDSWYSSARLICNCRACGWHVVCAIRSNRRVNNRSVRDIARTLGKREFTAIEVESSRGEKTAYRVASVVGYVRGLPMRCRVLISLRKKRDKSPFYLLSSDTTLPLQQVTQLYQGRWLVELLHWNLKVKLGFGQFRVTTLRGICRYATICILTQSLLESMSWLIPGATPTDAIHELRRARAEGHLRRAFARARKGVSIRTILRTAALLAA
ncbi:transposase [Candidatus Poribacteria bacterium]|nr:transposase [Candidatus Poribacteria bacterium]